MHVRSFTADPSSGVAHPGTFLGAIEKIPYLVDLGITAVELLPIFYFDDRKDYWGYSPIDFFTPHPGYVVSDGPAEFKMLVDAFHEHGIEVLLDVVYNHTAEQFAENDCYILDANGNHTNYTGCGNTFSANSPKGQALILESLRYWTSLGVDGFRFDLASALTRGEDGSPLQSPPLIEAINRDRDLKHVHLIAEPWDMGGLYQLGSFPCHEGRWLEWNDRFRDTARQFIRGDPGAKNAFAHALANKGRNINFITCHDGFTLRDLVSYNKKYNAANGEDNADGSNHNLSWNCGFEGPSDDPAINTLRDNQMRNFFTALLLAPGIPMIHMGDEYGHTKNGNNNTWCHDTRINWFQWDTLDKNLKLHRFVKELIAKRKKMTGGPISWGKTNWEADDRVLHFQTGNISIKINALDHSYPPW